MQLCPDGFAFSKESCYTIDNKIKTKRTVLKKGFWYYAEQRYMKGSSFFIG